MAGLRKLAGVQFAFACLFAGLFGPPAVQRPAAPAFEAPRPASSPDWGSRTAPSDTRLEKAQLGSGSLKPGFSSASGLAPNAAWIVPAGASLLARQTSHSVLPDRLAGPHSGRSPPHSA